MNKWEFISDEFYSNCLFEALKAKKRNSSVRIYFCKPRIAKNGDFQMPHFMWTDGTADYDFSDKQNSDLVWYKCLWFKGCIRKFKAGFAKWYSEYRNKRS